MLLLPYKPRWAWIYVSFLFSKDEVFWEILFLQEDRLCDMVVRTTQMSVQIFVFLERCLQNLNKNTPLS